MVTVNRASLRLLSIFIGLLFTGAVYYTMHNDPRWDWSAPGVGRLPKDTIRSFLHEAYDLGKGGTAGKDYFAHNAVDNAPGAQDRRDGNPMPHEIRSIIGQGMTVVVIHRIWPARGMPQTDAIDIFQLKDGRIIRRDRYLTRFEK